MNMCKGEEEEGVDERWLGEWERKIVRGGRGIREEGTGRSRQNPKARCRN